MRLSLLQMLGIVAVAGVIISGFYSSNLMYVAGVSFFLRLLIVFGIALAIAPTPYRSFWLGFVASVWFFHQFGGEPILEAMTAILSSKSGRPFVGTLYSQPESPDAIFEMAFNGPSMVYRMLVHNTLSLLVGVFGGLVATWHGRKHVKQLS